MATHNLLYGSVIVAALLASPMLRAMNEKTGSSETPSAPKEEARYQGRPTSYWIGRLSSQNAEDRKAALVALAAIGPEAANAVPALLMALEEEEHLELRLGVLETLGYIGPGAKAAVPALLRALKDKDETFRCTAICALGCTQSDDAAVGSALARQLQDNPSSATCSEVVAALRALGPHARKAALPVLVAIGKSQKGGWFPAIKALAITGSDAVPPLLAFLQDSNVELRMAAAKVLATFGPKASDAIPALETMLKQPRLEVMAANLTLMSMMEGPSGLTQVARLRSEVPNAVAAITLASIGPEAWPVLVAALKHESSRTPAALVLRTLGAKTVPLLIKALENEDAKTRSEAAGVLGQIGPPARDAVSALEWLLDDEDEQVRNEAQAALERIRQE